jgi:hypothetical protein
MALVKYARGTLRTSTTIFTLCLVVAAPISLCVAFLCPWISADELAVVIASPLMVFFVLGHVSTFLVKRYEIKPPESPAAHVRIVAELLLSLFFSVPCMLIYGALKIGWAAKGAAMVGLAAIAAILLCVLVRRLQGGAKNLLARTTLITSTMVATTCGMVIHVGSAWTDATTVLSAPLYRAHPRGPLA